MVTALVKVLYNKPNAVPCSKAFTDFSRNAGGKDLLGIWDSMCIQQKLHDFF